MAADVDGQASVPGREARASNLFACLCLASPEAMSPEAGRDLLIEVASLFSPRFECRRRFVTVDLRGLDRLFGTPREIGDAIYREALSRRVPVHVGVASTQTAAQIMALSRPGLTVVDAGQEASALAGMPLGVLMQMDMVDVAAATTGKAVAGAAAVVSVCERWGVRTLGELAALPAAEVVSRIGGAGRVWQGLARGEDRRPLVPTLAEERFESAMELEWPIEGLEPLSFVLTRLLEPVSIRLERADRGAARLHLHLRLINREEHLRSIDLPAPMREVRALRTLLLLDLESHPPETAIDRVTLVIDPTPGRILQHTLFTRPHPTPEQLSTLLARLGALLGQNRVGTARIVDAHRPGAFDMAPFALVHRQEEGRARRAATPSSASRAQATAGVHASSGCSEPRPTDRLVSALRRYRHPVPARVAVNDAGRPVRVTTDRRGLSGGVVVALAGPWRTSGAWWEDAPPSRTAGNSGAPQGRVEETGERPGARPPAGKATRVNEGGWDRDEWDVALGDRVLYRIFQERTSKAWFVDAVVD